MAQDDDIHPPPMSHGALFLRFLRFGFAAFGGPVAQIAMVRRELVERERWISSAGFNRLLAVMQALPGPEAHELCVHLGIRARGRLGGLLAGLGFMLPGFLLMLLSAWAYFRFDVERGAAGVVLAGAQAAVVALIVRATHRIGRHVLVDRWLWIIGAAAGAATLLAAPFWLVLPAGAALYGLARARRPRLAGSLLLCAVAALAVWALRDQPSLRPLVPTRAPAIGAGWLVLFGSGLKAGLLTFGGAYTAIPFVRQDLVVGGRLGDGTFLDGVALANVLPAPLIIFATFAGYAVGGLPGALAMTAGVFLPAFAFSTVFYDRLEAVVANPAVRGALDGVAAAVVGIIAATVVTLAAGLYDPARPSILPFAIAAASLAALYWLKGRYGPPLILLAAGLAGWLASL
ncbi:chromate efflux transporter [Brevundimonas sp.]|uniref:chromate efflux transporter n=1 Tax=Brevundimonas sp. TaxID=1871086 RepID=UPI002D4E1660|nr:chromate efflux transporter [Brevundimonas sp.]HYC66697.1 chromate efflux transporter [Brevundimonas sp.]